MNNQHSDQDQEITDLSIEYKDYIEDYNLLDEYLCLEIKKCGPIDYTYHKMMLPTSPDQDSCKQNSTQSRFESTWIGQILLKFDKTVLTLVIVSYMNLGFLTLMILSAKDYFKEFLGVTPSQLQTATSIMYLPWGFKVIYGVISDAFPLFGYKRKSYLIINGFIGFISILMIVPGIYEEYVFVTMLLTFAMVASASTDILVDSLLASEAKKDKLNGSENLQFIANTFSGIGGVLGAILGAIFTQYTHPKYGFLIYSCLGLSLFLASLNLKEKRISNNSEEQTTLENSYKQLLEAVKNKKIQKVILFQIISGAIVPRFSQYKYFFMLDYQGMSQFNFGLLSILCSCTLILLALFFSKMVQKYSYRQAFAFGILLTSFTTACDIIYVLRINRMLYINDYIMLIFTNLLEDIMQTRYLFYCSGVVHNRLAPSKVEATIMALFAGFSNIGFGVIAQFFGNFCAEIIGVNNENIQDIYKLLIIKLVFSFVPLTFLRLIPNKDEIENDVDLQRLNKNDDNKEQLLI
ncbi:UNKNOWN [Stylonychia lemnae]|uniref:Folate-biopterin transporter family n=1 Tax=Stylonychia lemnae TaxID=5949 RepID=A0A078A910_STYLE|nr:UNKNOWN [Stylonychia lemnae]|eukprot:CDW78704.1 UNKNOWN [Stylonychia lemnae]